VIEVDDATFIQQAVRGGMPEAGARAAASFGVAMRTNTLNIKNEALQILLRRKPQSLRELLMENRAQLLAEGG
jgi:hypothetical protein